MKNGYCKILVLLIALCSVMPLTAQEARPAVIAACGASSQSIDGYTISFTVGEPVILTAGTNTVFTQGFHQPLIARDYPLVTLNLRAAIYPNPVNATLFLQLFSERQTKAAITLHNLAGQQVLRRELNLPAGYSSHTLEMGHMKAGMYILTVRDATTNGTLHVKLVKQ